SCRHSPTEGNPSSCGVPRSCMVNHTPSAMLMIPGVSIAACQPHQWAAKAQISGIIAPPILMEVFQQPHQKPRSLLEYQWVSSRAHGGQPQPWKKPFSVQMHSSAGSGTPNATTTLKSPV